MSGGSPLQCKLLSERQLCYEFQQMSYRQKNGPGIFVLPSSAAGQVLPSDDIKRSDEMSSIDKTTACHVIL